MAEFDEKGFELLALSLDPEAPSESLRERIDASTEPGRFNGIVDRLARFFDLEPSNVPGFFLPKLKTAAKDAIYIPGNFRDNLPNIDPATAARLGHVGPLRI